MADSNIGVFLKPLLILALILGIFSWIFIQSQTLERFPSWRHEMGFRTR